MSTPLATIFEGDVTLEQGSDVAQFGWGDLKVNRRVIVYGTDDSTGAASQGSLIVDGGVRIAKSLHAQQNANVLYGVTRLTETRIDTTNGPVTITGGNTVSISVGASSQFISTGGNLTLGSNDQSVQLYGGLNGATAVDIAATNAGGGVRVMSGDTGVVSFVAGSGGISGFTSNGNISLTSNNANGSFIVNSLTSNQNLVLGVAGATDSQIRIESSGINDTRTAMILTTTNTAGHIAISNAGGLGDGSITNLVGSGGYNVLTNTGGAISITSRGAESLYRVQSAGPNQNMTVELIGDTDSSLKIQSSGTNASVDAISIKTTHINGSISVSQPTGSLGGISMLTGTGGFETLTQSGSITMHASGASSTYTNSTIGDNQDLIVSVTGNTDSRVVISSSGTGQEAVKIQTTNGTGGVLVSSVGGIQLQSSDPYTGVRIATETPGIPTTIGTPTGVTTILGDLFVRGNTSSVDQQVVTIDDNIIVVNNGPYGTSDGGIAIKRYQPANDTGVGDVVIDSPDHTGTVQNGGNTLTSIHLSSTASSTDDYYNGWWVKILSGTGAGQVRRIKDYDGLTKIATIYSTAEQTGLLANPQPVEGMDFITVPDITSTYGVYACHFVMNIWDESNNEFALVCSTTNPSDPNNPSFEPVITHYSNLHINNLQSNAIYTNTINDSLADIITTIVLNDNSTTPVTIPGVPHNYGIYMIYVKPESVTTRTYAIFMIGRVNVSTTPGTFTRLLSVKGAQNEQLSIQWRADEFPELYYRPQPGGGGSTTYKVKIVSL